MARTVSKKNIAKYKKVTALVESGMVLSRALKKMKCSYTSYTRWYRNNNVRLFNEEDCRPVRKKDLSPSEVNELEIAAAKELAASAEGAYKAKYPTSFKEMMANAANDPQFQSVVDEIKNNIMFEHTLSKQVRIEYCGTVIYCLISDISMVMAELNRYAETIQAE